MSEVVNLKRLSEELGVSVSTVSRALRDSHEIGEETKQKVRSLAERLGFIPNQHAASLRRKKSKTVAVIIPEIQHAFFSQVISGIEEVALKKGYHVLIYLTHEDGTKEQEIVNLLRNGRVDGMMISVAATTKDFSHFEAARAARIPIVFFDRTCTAVDVPNVTTNNSDISFAATTHLIKNGCKDIAFLSMPSHLSITQKRREGYLKALKKQSLLNNQNVIECGLDHEENKNIIRELLLGKNAPDGIFASAEKLAVITYELSKELQIEIPEELKVVSFSNFTATSLFDPPLTTIIQPAMQMGYEAASVLFKTIENKVLLPNEKKIVIPSHIAERESSTNKMSKVLR